MIPLTEESPGDVKDTSTPEPGWKVQLSLAIQALMNHERVTSSISAGHIKDTPGRVVKAFSEYFSGLMEDPEDVLRQGFEAETYSQMVFLGNIPFTSLCAHHLVPFLGRVHFGYLPRRKIVGLSKIPRLVEIYSRRPQVQEKLTEEIAETFRKVVVPDGCGVVVDAVHLCIALRGVRKNGVVTRTTALKGNFLEPSVRQEFLASVPSVESFSWT